MLEHKISGSGWLCIRKANSNEWTPVFELTVAQRRQYCETYQEAAAPGKGEYTGECARTACNNRDAVCYNHQTYKFYCRGCAMRIQESGPTIRLFDEFYRPTQK